MKFLGFSHDALSGRNVYAQKHSLIRIGSLSIYRDAHNENAFVLSDQHRHWEIYE